MRLKQWSIVAVSVVFLATIVGVGLEGVWAQDETEPLTVSIELGEPTLLAKGAGVDVPVVITCTAAEGFTGTWGYFSVHVRQVSNRRTVVEGANSEGFTPTCDGSSQTLNITIFGNGSAAFKKGTALITANTQVEGYNPNGGQYGSYASASDSISSEVRIN